MNKIMISSEVLDASLAALRKLDESLQPQLIVLSGEEVKELDKLGNVSYSFVRKSVVWGKLIPELVPAYHNTLHTELLLVQHDTVLEMEVIVERMYRSLVTSRMQIGSEIKKYSKDVYDTAKRAAKHNVSGAKEAEADLSELYIKKSYTRKENPNVDPDDIKL